MAENNQIAQTPQSNGGLAKLKTILNAPSVQEQFQNALAENKDLFVASIIDLYNGDASLQTCNPSAIVSEALKAAVLDLPINRALGFAYIVVYNNSVKVKDPQTGRESWTKVPTPTFVPGYKGFIQLAMRTGQYRTINADYVYDGELRTTNRLSGEIALDGKRKSDKIVGFFCYFELLNGYRKTLYMSVEEICKAIRTRHQARHDHCAAHRESKQRHHIEVCRLGRQLQRHGIEDGNTPCVVKVRLSVYQDAERTFRRCECRDKSNAIALRSTTSCRSTAYRP